MPLELDFYYGNEAEQYSFYRIPKALFTDSRFKSVSIESKVLYGLLLDRMGLSIRNSWLDSDGRVFLYFTLEDTMLMMGCGHGKAVRLFAELDKENGIGLIERKKQGQGKPTKIYVKNFITSPDAKASQNGKSETTPPEVLTSQNRKSALPESRTPDLPKWDANNTDINNTDLSETDPSIYPGTEPDRYRQDKMDSIDIYTEIIKENISYPLLLERYPYDHEAINGIVDLMVETVCTTRKTIGIAREELPSELVKSRMLKLDETHIEYVMDSLKRNTTKVYNIRSYLLTALFRAPTTISAHYTALVNHDMYGCKDG